MNQDHGRENVAIVAFEYISCHFRNCDVLCQRPKYIASCSVLDTLNEIPKFIFLCRKCILNTTAKRDKSKFFNLETMKEISSFEDLEKLDWKNLENEIYESEKKSKLYDDIQNFYFGYIHAAEYTMQRPRNSIKKAETGHRKSHVHRPKISKKKHRRNTNKK